ncbi:undecaprenyldiphospho-muramoylpentapeptide beta-N-acetylglucosaminyltransferase [Hazenella sp. IB182357]|uniref:UDP-N-acetylglucosamine--N-acetylmuramyl-(pentapeptide) pyrophosphoryl-undecaprenol N-acetylglucosamine transferase n=1 Tax=Polycladospora coralii TaxID=2771432 RepID=A0A926RV30_9BACL|nr:undecaprenyldiphospho-muramoylpentapeptide beta-N-acetylglucosaminyltransferase [Polycladospora coralii]MBD1373109.1 undecaprenyldiphospho-muramoylpentapeptide beta-N-acetylglucosaminyltransferase [Polycladospora coralii]MBS7531667.1 undecaprenyldiphospho-muramoylpentapeptide beta-N-acetylglucosaminyltransferase [Polycladospora coralii]
MTKRMLMTGGGSAGHVTVNLALIPELQKEGWEISYIGSEDGIEKQLLQSVPGVAYHSISTGKLRRYFDWNNFKDPFKVLKGVAQAYRVIRKQKPKLIFSKGGFVSVPVIIGGWFNRVPIIIHESDLTPGLANKIATPFATKVCVTFPETKAHIKGNKAEYVGAIIRDELKQGDGETGKKLCGFTNDKPVLLMMGGSLGSQKLNGVLRHNLIELTKQFQVVHICGKGQVDDSFDQVGYKQFEYIKEELPHIMAMADIVVSRAGSNSIFEFLALKKPMLLIPLSRNASRGDQILNAKSFQKMGYCEMVEEEELTDALFLQKIEKLLVEHEQYIENMQKSEGQNSLQQVMAFITQMAK